MQQLPSIYEWFSYEERQLRIAMNEGFISDFNSLFLPNEKPYTAASWTHDITQALAEFDGNPALLSDSIFKEKEVFGFERVAFLRQALAVAEAMDTARRENNLIGQQSELSRQVGSAVNEVFRDARLQLPEDGDGDVTDTRLIEVFGESYADTVAAGSDELGMAYAARKRARQITRRAMDERLATTPPQDIVNEANEIYLQPKNGTDPHDQRM